MLPAAGCWDRGLAAALDQIRAICGGAEGRADPRSLSGLRLETRRAKTPLALSLPEKLLELQELMEKGDQRARKVYQSIGVYLGFGIAHYSDFYNMRKILPLGRVTTGDGGTIIIEQAKYVLQEEFPE